MGAGWRINVDIGGCGLEHYYEKYDKDAIEECSKHCYENAKFQSFTLAPLDGDKNHPGKAVCTIYDTDLPNQTWGPNQVMCKQTLIPLTEVPSLSVHPSVSLPPTEVPSLSVHPSIRLSSTTASPTKSPWQHIYHSREKLTWQEHYDISNYKWITLASVHNQDQVDYIKYLTILNCCEGGWLGCIRQPNIGSNWTWADGSLFNYENYFLCQPNNAGNNENCLNLSCWM